MSYCWTYPWKNNDSLHGPFETLDECKANCLGSLSLENGPVVFYTVKYVCAEDWADGIFDIGDVLERMGNNLFLDTGIDDRVFFVPLNFNQDAKSELDQLIKSWAIKHVIATDAWFADKEVLRATLEDLRMLGQFLY